MSIHQRSEPSPARTNDGDEIALSAGLEALAREYGNRFLLEPAPDHHLPEHGMRAVDAMRLIGEELVLEWTPRGDTRLSLNAFETRAREMIVLDYDPARDVYVFRNAGELRMRGVEFELERHWRDGALLRANMSRQRADGS